MRALFLMLKPFCVLMFWVACAAAQMVEGTVVNSITGGGIASVKVEIVQSDKALYSATTDAQGHFRIESVKDGTYTARYSSPRDYYESEPSGLLRKVPRPFQVTAGGAVKL